MSCAACHHRFSAWEILRVVNPLSFSCPRCGVRLTIDKLGYAVLGVVCVLAALAAKYVAAQYLAGSLSLSQSLLVLVLIIVAFAPVELLYNRFARYKRK
jgi:hypothetical protein